MHLVPYSCQNLSQNHCLSNLESVPTDGIPPPCFLHLFNLFSVHFEPFPWKTWHNTISFCLNCYSGHVWNVRYSWAQLEISVKISFIGKPRDCSRILVTYTSHSIISWRAGLLCLVGGKSFMQHQEQSCFWKRSHGCFICHLMHVFQPGWWSPQPGLTHGSESLFRPRLWPGPFRSHRGVMAIKKNLPSFCLAGHGKAIVENVPDVRTPMNSKRGRHGCKGKTSVTLVPCFPFWVCPLCWKLPSCSKVLLSWRRWSMPWVVEVDHTACSKNPWLMYPRGIFLLMEIKGFGSQMGRHLGGKWLS